MDVVGFQKWLLSVKGLKRATCQSRLSNCTKVEKYEGDLDAMYESDRLEELLQRLTYTTDDERNAVPSKHLVPLAGKLRSGSATLKSAVSLYRDFRDSQHLDVLLVTGSDDAAAEYRRQLLWGDFFLKSYATQLEFLHSDGLFNLIIEKIDRLMGDDSHVDNKAVVTDVFESCRPENRYPELSYIMSDVTDSGYKDSTVYYSVYCAMKILDMARS